MPPDTRLKPLHRETPFALPVRVAQFGGGNFLRAFIDWQIDLLNERRNLNAGVVVLRSIGRTNLPLLDTQGGVYTTLIRGLNEAGEAVREYRRITCVQREIDVAGMYDDFLALAHEPHLRFVVSNTTEAGIATNEHDAYSDVPPASFPAKLTRLLHERFRHVEGAPDKGLVMLPCELIDHNGEALRKAVRYFADRWQLGPAFQHWLDTACTFCSTLVDRIVTGYPDAEMTAIEAELGYRDRFLVAAEYDYLFLIEGPPWLADELCLGGSGLNIRLVDDITPFKQRKVGILNGGHTAMVPVALLAGLDSVGGAMKDPDVRRYLDHTLYEEIMPALPLPRADLEPFAAAVMRRFQNPYIHHRLESIALNSWSKFAARLLPQLLQYRARFGTLPPGLVLSLAATMILYRGRVIKLADDAATIAWFESGWCRVAQGQWSLHDLATHWLANKSVWGTDLSTVPALVEGVVSQLVAIDRYGIRNVISNVVSAVPR